MPIKRCRFQCDRSEEETGQRTSPRLYTGEISPDLESVSPNLEKISQIFRCVFFSSEILSLRVWANQRRLWIFSFSLLKISFIFWATKQSVNGSVLVAVLDQMAEGAVHSRYVKLTKDQGPLEDIKPGELNQPIDVPQVSYSMKFLAINKFWLRYLRFL